MSDPTARLDELAERAEAAARAGGRDEAVAAWRADLAHQTSVPRPTSCFSRNS